MKLYFLKVIVSLFLILLLGQRVVNAIDDSILDPLKLKKPSSEGKKTNYNKFPQSTITSITSDSSTKTLTICAIPRVNSSYLVSGKTVEITLINSFLHPTLANKSYDWQYKLKNQLYNLATVTIKDNIKLKRVTITLKFSNNIRVQEVRQKKSVVNYTFLKDKTSFFRNQLENKNPALSKSDKNMPSIFFSNNDQLSIANNNTTYDQEDTKYLPEPVDPGKLIENKELQPQNYSRTDNDFIDTPNLLHDFNRPEKTDNNLLNANDYEDILKLATFLLSQGKLEEGKHKLNQAITLNSAKPEAYKLLAEIYFKEKNYTEAINNYEITIRNNDTSEEVLNNLASLYEIAIINH